MSILSEITRITGLRDRIRSRLTTMGLLLDELADLEACADAIDGISSLTIESHPVYYKTLTKTWATSCLVPINQVKTIFIVANENASSNKSIIMASMNTIIYETQFGGVFLMHCLNRQTVFDNFNMTFTFDTYQGGYYLYNITTATGSAYLLDSDLTYTMYYSYLPGSSSSGVGEKEAIP